MKRIFKHLAFGLAAATMLSCTEGGLIDEGNATDPSGDNLTFVLSGFRATDGITYADGRIASDAEDTISNLNIYMFDYQADGSGVYKGVWSFTGADLTPVGSNKSISLGPLLKADYGDGKKVYYFVANKSTTSANLKPELDVTTENDFRNTLTNTLTYANQMQRLRTPLLFTGRSIPMGLVGTAPIQLMRRAARFDIVNDYHEDLLIKQITISKPASAGYIFENNDGSATIPASANNFNIELPEGAEYVEKLNTAGTKNEWIAESMFYLYPTEVPGSTTITLTGTYEGSDFVYHINTKSDIRANYRYKLVATKGAQMTFNMMLLDWNEGGEVDLGYMNGIEISNGTVSQGNATFVENELTLYARAREVNVLTFDASATSTYGIDMQGTPVITPAETTGVNFSFSADPVTGDPTYANNGKVYTQKCTLTINAVSQSRAFTGKVVLVDAMNPYAKTTINIVAYEPTSNSYMISPGDQPLEITMRQIQYASEVSTVQPLEEDETLTAEMLWTDNQFGMSAPGVVSAIELTGKGPEALLYVTPGSGAGNAVIAVKDGAGKIRWSWHIWNTDYKPVTSERILDDKHVYEAVGGKVHRYSDNLYQNGKMWEPNGRYMNRFIMDRNLGATSAHTKGNEKEGVLYYQWGRKDPFPSDVKIYDASGTQISTDGTDWVLANYRDAAVSIGESVNTPWIFYKDITGGTRTWTTEILKHTNAEGKTFLWHDSSALYSNIYAKSVFDPCPEGWALPMNGTFSCFAWYNNTTPSGWAYGYGDYGLQNRGISRTRGDAWADGNQDGEVWYPMHGRRIPELEHVPTAYTSGTSGRGHGYYWDNDCFSTNYQTGDDVYAAVAFDIAYDMVIYNHANFYRSTGMNIRCVSQYDHGSR